MNRSSPISAREPERSNLSPRLPYEDLRGWLDEARKLGEVKEVSGLSWQQDIGLVAEMALRQDSAPCFVFEDVPGTIAGSRVLVNFFGGNSALLHSPSRKERSLLSQNNHSRRRSRSFTSYISSISMPRRDGWSPRMDLKTLTSIGE